MFFIKDSTKQTCSVCENNEQTKDAKFCNHCGAKMTNNH